ncbi:MAG: hypothetical protein Q7J76_09795 [Candidatus Brocadiaceae bacterium]|nr:hypothetical protein [Candidatus Brocadiaceae bacterium]
MIISDCLRQRRQHDDDLHPCLEQRRSRWPKPGRWVIGRIYSLYNPEWAIGENAEKARCEGSYNA